MSLILVSAISLLVLAAAILFFVLTISRHERIAIGQRLDLMTTGIKPPETAGPIEDANEAPLASQRIRRIISLGLSHTWGTRAGPGFVLLMAACAAVSVWAILALAMKAPAWMALSLAVVVFALLPRFILGREQQKAENRFVDFFPDAVDMGVRMLRAGLPISTAIRAIGNEAAPPVDTVFKGIADQVKIGIPFEDALASSAIGIGLPDFRFFSVAVTLQRATGGNLAATLETLSDIMRKRRAVRLKARATTAEVRVSAYILGGLPFLVTGVLLLIQPGYLTPLFTDPRGQIILGLAAVMLTIGFLVMRQMMRSAVKV
ncbi:MAG TPA: type II secretion system F family protein [Micropepsaceae bacterium]|nr:type II secretion system F family protein [Micropepsaceae bacterium]